jgi:L,D-peptidoglycan transpeptidase YkuD (ErfK/YbiS/YcfS/YnhG family)
VSQQRRCVYCRGALDEDALLCATCHQFQPPEWVARLQASWIQGLLRIGVVGGLVWGISQAYQIQSLQAARLAERARSIADSAMVIQTLSDELRTPCWSREEKECALRFDRIVKELAGNAYLFKESARPLFARDSAVGLAINFVDDFFNPGVAPPEHLAVLPLQQALLRSSPLLSRPFDAARWCSLEGRARMRELTTSIDVYRYCYGLVRRHVAEYAAQGHSVLPWLGRFASTVTDDQLRGCASARDPDVYRVANAIQATIGSLDESHSAPWLYDSFCPTSISGPDLPGSVGQLLVVVTPRWEATAGALRLYERPPRQTGWRLVASDIPVVLGAGGLGWGQGIHPASFSVSAAGRGVPVKSERDSRAPAGMFTLGGLYGARDPGRTLLPFHGSEADLICDDAPASPRYNQAYRAKERLAACGTGGVPCPERLRRGDALYDLLVWVNHNLDGAAKEAGSCIFLHIWRGPGTTTAGCTAMDEQQLETIARWLDPARRPVLVQLPEAEYLRVQVAWGLPALAGQGEVAR